MKNFASNKNHSPSKGSLRRKDDFIGLIFVIPSLLFLAVLIIFPVVRTAIQSFFVSNYFSGTTRFAGFANYAEVLKDSTFWRALGVDVIWTVGSLSGQLLVGLAVALLINKQSKFMVVIRTLLLVPYIIPVVAMCLTFRWMLNDTYGIISKLLNSLGLLASGSSLLSQATTALPTVIFINIYRAFPFVMICYWAALQTISLDLYEAANIDGASGWQKFRYITLPGLKTITLTLLVIRTIWNFNYYDLIYLLTQGGPAQSTQHLPILIYTQAMGMFNFNEAATISMLMGIILAVAIFVYMRSFGKDDTQ